MKEGLVIRIGRIISASANSLVDSVENVAPAMVMEEAIREVDGAIDEVRKELGTLEAQKHMASKRLQAINDDHAKLDEQSQIALKEGRDDLASVAIEKQMDIESQIPVLEKSVADTNDKLSELNSYIQALKAKRREMEDSLKQFSETIQNEQDSHVATMEEGRIGSHKAEKAISSFDRILEKNSGVPQVNSSANQARLAELDELSRKNKIQERLARLKAQQEE